jgi:putative ABC transport system substrate-binding protein
MELLKEAFPKAKRLGMLDDGLPTSRLLHEEAAAVASKLGVQLVVVKAPPGHYDRAFGEMTTRQVDALRAVGSPIHNQDRKHLIALTARHRLPAIWEWRYIAEEGGPMSYGASEVALVRRVAVYVDKLPKGAKPAELPVEQPTTLELVVNLMTAKALGVTIPPSVLLRADHVIQ